MINLKINCLILPLILFLFFGCQHSEKFKLKSDFEKELHVIEIDSSRITHECYFMNAEKENNWRYLYTLNMLTEDNEVISAYNPTNQGKPECLAQFRKVEKVLEKEPRVKLCVRDKLEKISNPELIIETHDFGPLGKHKSQYDALTFDTICNSKECFSISETWNYTCPGFVR